MTIKLSRRKFLKITGGLTVSLALPFKTVQVITKSIDSVFKYEKFNPKHEYAASFPVVTLNNQSRQIIQVLALSLAEVIPERYLTLVQFRLQPPYDFGRTRHVGWYYNPYNEKGYIGPYGKWFFDNNGSFLIWRKA